MTRTPQQNSAQDTKAGHRLQPLGGRACCAPRTATRRPSHRCDALSAHVPIEQSVSLRVRQSKGDGGVLRLYYRNTIGKTVGTARLLGTTIGPVEVNPNLRRRGYGQAILRDLITRGGRSLIAVTEEGQRLAEREGFILDVASEFHTFQGPTKP